MTLDYSIINNKPAIGFADLSYDVGSAITEYVRSVPIGSQVTVSVTNLVSGTTTVLQEGTDYYTGADGIIVVDRDLVPFGAQISFSLDTDFENFYDDFSDLGAAPSGPVKRRTQQLQNMALQLRDRIETLESGDIDIDFTETSIIAGNNTYGPGDFQIDTADAITLTDVAGTGFRLGLNYNTFFADPFVTERIDTIVANYIGLNPPASGVVTVSGRSPDEAGNIDLAATDVSGLNAVATSGDYADLINTPQDLSDFNNDEGFIGTTELDELNESIDDKLDASALDGGATGQVLKKTSGANGAYAWADESGGSGGGASILSDLGDVTFAGNPALNQFLVYTGSTWENQLLNSTKISNFDTDVDARINAVGFDGDYDSLINKPTLRTDQEVRDLADAQITAYVDANPVLPSIQQNSADIATNAGNIATNTTNITNNATAIAGKFDEPTGTPSTGDVIEWDGSQAAWAAPSGGSGGGARIWSCYFDRTPSGNSDLGAGSFDLSGNWSFVSTSIPNERDTLVDRFGSGAIEVGTSLGSYSNGGFTISETGTYKVSWSLNISSYDATGGMATASDIALIRNNGTNALNANDEVLRRSMEQFKHDDVSTQVSDHSVSIYAHSSLVALNAGDEIGLWLSGHTGKQTVLSGTWMIEKVG